MHGQVVEERLMNTFKIKWIDLHSYKNQDLILSGKNDSRSLAQKLSIRLLNSVKSKEKTRRILLDNSGYVLANLGDTAMLQVAIKRLREHLPDAEILVFTNSEEKLQKYCPGTIAISPTTREKWLSAKLAPIPVRIVPKPLRNRIRKSERTFKLRAPVIANIMMRITSRLVYGKESDGQAFFERIRAVDIVLASGGGYITDSFPSHAKNVLSTLLIAQRMGIPTAMFGQGIGPLKNQEVIALAKKTFPNLKALGVREGLESVSIAKEFGVPDERIWVTGDDAIEIAINSIDHTIERNCIGVNIRLASYAGNLDLELTRIGKAIEQIASCEKTPIIPIPIHIGDSNRDLSSTQKMCSIDKSEIIIAESISTPEALIHQISRCRVVVTGSYHAAVFALAQGIPVVAIVGSDYYRAKFQGLANQFEIGCKIVSIDSVNLIESLQNSIVKTLAFPEKETTKLIEKAKEQVELSRTAWKRFLCHEFDHELKRID